MQQHDPTDPNIPQHTAPDFPRPVTGSAAPTTRRSAARPMAWTDPAVGRQYRVPQSTSQSRERRAMLVGALMGLRAG